MNLVLIILLIVLLCGGGYGYHSGWYGNGGISLVGILLLLVVLRLLGII